jgi:hypothetical protein
MYNRWHTTTQLSVEDRYFFSRSLRTYILLSLSCNSAENEFRHLSFFPQLQYYYYFYYYYYYLYLLVHPTDTNNKLGTVTSSESCAINFASRHASQHVICRNSTMVVNRQKKLSDVYHYFFFLLDVLFFLVFPSLFWPLPSWSKHLSLARSRNRVPSTVRILP